MRLLSIIMLFHIYLLVPGSVPMKICPWTPPPPCYVPVCSLLMRVRRFPSQTKHVCLSQVNLVRQKMLVSQFVRLARRTIVSYLSEPDKHMPVFLVFFSLCQTLLWYSDVLTQTKAFSSEAKTSDSHKQGWGTGLWRTSSWHHPNP